MMSAITDSNNTASFCPRCVQIFVKHNPRPRAVPQECCMRKEALRLAVALLPALLYIAAAPAGNVFA